MFTSKLVFITSVITFVVSQLGAFLVQRQILIASAQQITSAVSTDLRTGFYWKVTETLTPLAGGQFRQIHWERMSSIQHSLRLLPSMSEKVMHVPGTLRINLQDAEKTIGRLTFDYDALPGLFGGLFIWLIQTSVLLLFLYQGSKSEKLRERLRIDAAIARTTQMLAHDVRKPFALFRMTLDRVKSADSPELMHDALSEALPEVERSLASVNGLISDVLNVGGEFSLVLKPVRLAAVVDSVLEELKTLYPTRRIDLQVLVPQDLWLAADDTRLPRVFLNLFSNAIEAVDSQDARLWVSATPDAHSPEQFEVRAGNSGSFIGAEGRARLFDLFYTSGKKGGTGLGLAIVKKILEGHGTAVTCLSEKSTLHPQGKVEFVWTMRSSRPCSESVDEQGFRKAGDTDQVAQVVPLSLAESHQPSAAVAKLDAALAPAQQSAAPADASLLQIAFIDDSPLVRWAWENKLKGKVEIVFYAGPREFWGAVDVGSLQLQRLHTIITDHYFAPDEECTGLEFAARLRDRGFSGRILLASNGEFQPEKLRGIVDKIVDKQPVDWDELKA